jgi:hypothetical protein
MKLIKKINWMGVLHPKHLSQATRHTCELWIAII